MSLSTARAIDFKPTRGPAIDPIENYYAFYQVQEFAPLAPRMPRLWDPGDDEGYYDWYQLTDDTASTRQMPKPQLLERLLSSSVSDVERWPTGALENVLDLADSILLSRGRS